MARRGFSINVPAQQYLTTFEVGKACGVFHTTVINWVNKGYLKARRTPGGHRRVARHDLVAFMKKFKMEVPSELSDTPRKTLVLTTDAALRRTLLDALENIGLEVQTGGMEALLTVGPSPLALVVLDDELPGVDQAATLKALRADLGMKAAKLIALRRARKKGAQQLWHADAVLRKPISGPEVRERAKALLA